MVNVGRLPDGSSTSNNTFSRLCESTDAQTSGEHVGIPERPLRPRSNPIQIARSSDLDISSVPVSNSEPIVFGRPSSTPPGQWVINSVVSGARSTLFDPSEETHGTPVSQEVSFNIFLDSEVAEDGEPARSVSNDFLVADSSSPSTPADVWVTSNITKLSVSCENPTTSVLTPIGHSDGSFLFPTSSPSEFTSSNTKFNLNATPIRTKLKRPHSAISGDTNPIQLDELATRPYSAPKRLVEETCDPISELFVDGSTLSFTTLGSTTLVAEDSDVNDIYPPKSTLEALVASNSPLLFFPTGYSLDTDQDAGPLCDFLSTSPAKSRTSPVDSYEAGGSNYTMDPESNNPDYLVTDGGSDILNGNSANSVSSSRSLASVDLCETVPKGCDSQGSPSTTLGELSMSSKTYLDAPCSITTHLSAFVEAMRSYAAELCPVDCVILMERCRPFNCDTLFMKYFREQYLCPILSNLNGGPPLNADFGRDAYTSLYSLHGFYWRKPRPISTWVPDTPIIYRILKQIASVKHEERHATNEHADMFFGTPGHELLEAAVEAFDGIDRARRGLCKQVQRHLILLTCSPINLTEVHKEFISSEADAKSGPLANLRRRGVALSAFAPISSPTLLQLYEMVNGTPPSPFYDRHWQTVALSPKLLNSDSPEHRVIGPLAADAHAQAEAELLLAEQRHQKKLLPDQSLPDSVLVNGHSHPLTGPLRGSSPSSPARYASKMQRNPSQLSANYSDGYLNGQSANITSGIAANANLPDNSYRITPNKTGHVGAPGSNSVSPMGQPQAGHACESPVSQGHRALRASSHGRGSTPPTSASRNSVPRPAPEGTRPTEQPQVPISCSSLSAGHSGPNSVDQLGPGSAYGSDSVATPQGFSVGITSPQQGYNTGTTMPNQLYSPASSSLANAGQAQAPYQPYQQLPSEGPNAQLNLRPSTGMAQSPGSTQATFRPPSNAASPAGQLVSYVNTVGLSSPSASRGSTRQYSPQLPPQQQQQASHHQRHTSPHSGGPPHGSHQSVRSHQLPSPDSSSMSGARSRSLTPVNFPPGGSSAQSMSNAYQLKENIPNSSGPGPTGNWLAGHPMCGNVTRPYESQTYRSGPPTASSAYPISSQTGLNAGRPSAGSFGANQGGPGMLASSSMHRDPNSLAASGRLDPGSHQPMRRQQSSPLEMQAQGPPSRSVLWEGEVHMNEPNSSGPSRLKMSLNLEQVNVRDLSQLNMQLWGPVAQLSIILAHRDSTLVHRLTSNAPGGNVLGQVSVDLPQSEEAHNLVSALSSSISPAAVPLGILSPPPNTVPNPIPPGSIGFVCLSYNLKRNHISGLIPADSEQFRQDLHSSRQHGFAKSVTSLTEGSAQLQRSYAPAVSRSATNNVEEQFLLRSGMLAQSSFVTPNSGSMYVQRPMGTMSTGDRSNPNAPAVQVYPNQPHPHYQSSVSTAQMPSSAPYMQTTGFNAKNQLNFISMQQQATLQRNTPSPPHRQREMILSQPGADPQQQPAQWIGSQVEIPHHGQGRGVKPSLPQQQQIYSQRPQLHAKPSQSYAFQPQPRASSDRFMQGTGGGVSMSNVVSQSAMTNEPMGIMDHRNSPQFMVSNHQPQQRFLANSNPTFQGTQPGYPGPGGTNPSYSGPSCGQRTVFPSQGPTGYQPSNANNNPAVGGYPQSGPGGYNSRATAGTGGIPQSAAGVSGYRFAPEHMVNGGSNNNNVGFMQMQSVHSNNHPMDSKLHHPPQHPASMDSQTYQTVPTRSLNCNLVPVDGSTMGANSAQTMQQTGSHFSSIPTQDPSMQQTQPPIQAPPSMYGSMHPQQHSNYDAFGPSGFF